MPTLQERCRKLSESFPGEAPRALRKLPGSFQRATETKISRNGVGRLKGSPKRPHRNDALLCRFRPRSRISNAFCFSFRCTNSPHLCDIENHALLCSFACRMWNFWRSIANQNCMKICTVSANRKSPPAMQFHIVKTAVSSAQQLFENLKKCDNLEAQKSGAAVQIHTQSFCVPK